MSGAESVINLAVMCGGDSAEREISLQSGAGVAQAAREAGMHVVEVDPQSADWVDAVRQVDVVFIALHGPGGEDGAMQGMLQTLGVPYTGSGILGSALALDKQRSKEIWQAVGIATPGFVLLNEDSDWQAVIDQFGCVFVKPVMEGSSIGMSRAEDADALAQSYALARQYGPVVIAEQFIDGPEYTVGILGDQVLPSIRMETQNTFYDYEAKYFSDDTRYHCPSGLGDVEEAELGQLALRAFNTLACEVWGRVDVMRDQRGEFYVLEVNTSPGMTSHSLVPMAAKATGMPMPALIRRIVELSMAEVRG